MNKSMIDNALEKLQNAQLHDNMEDEKHIQEVK